MEKITAANIKEYIQEIADAIQEFNRQIDAINNQEEEYRETDEFKIVDLATHERGISGGMGISNVNNYIDSWKEYIENGGKNVEEAKQKIEYLTKVIELLENNDKYDLKRQKVDQTLQQFREKKAKLEELINQLRTEMKSCNTILKDIAFTSILDNPEAMGKVIDGLIANANEDLKQKEEKKKQLLEKLEQTENDEKLLFELSCGVRSEYNFTPFGRFNPKEVESFRKYLSENNLYEQLENFIKRFANDDTLEVLNYLKNEPNGAWEKYYNAYPNEFKTLAKYTYVLMQANYSLKIPQDYIDKTCENQGVEFDDKIYFGDLNFISKKDLIKYIKNITSESLGKDNIDNFNRLCSLSYNDFCKLVSKINLDTVTYEECLLLFEMVKPMERTYLLDSEGENLSKALQSYYKQEKRKKYPHDTGRIIISRDLEKIRESRPYIKSELARVEDSIASSHSFIKSLETGDKKHLIELYLNGFQIREGVIPVPESVAWKIIGINDFYNRIDTNQEELTSINSKINDFENSEYGKLHIKYIDENGEFKEPYVQLVEIVRKSTRNIDDAEALLHSEERNEEEKFKSQIQKLEKELEDLKNSAENRKFTKKNGELVKGKVGRFFFKIFNRKQYKNNIDQITNSEKKINEEKERITVESQNPISVVAAKKELERLIHERENAITKILNCDLTTAEKIVEEIESISSYSLTEFMYGSTPAINSENSEKNAEYRVLLKRRKQINSDINLYKLRYFDLIKDLLNDSTLPVHIKKELEVIISSDEVRSIEVSNESRAYARELEKHSYDPAITDSIRAGIIDPTMDSDEAVTIIQGKRK